MLRVDITIWETTMSTSTEPMPHETLWALSIAGFVARSLQVVAQLGIADQIEDQPIAAEELAKHCGASPDALNRVLRLLAAHGVFYNDDAGNYGHTPPSRLLRSDHPATMRAYAQMMGLPLIWGSLTELEHSVRTGRPGLDTVEPNGPWAYLSARPDEADIFAHAMTAKAAAEVAAVLKSYDFSRFPSVADIGGGRGHLLHAVLDAAPGTTGILFDLPAVVDTLDIQHPRLTPTAGDFFQDPLPAAAAYVLMEILHDWPDEECVSILQAVRRAAPPDAVLLIIEGVLTDGQPDARASTLDLVMLTVTGGRERSATEMETLLDRAGFDLTDVVDTPSPMRIVQAEPRPVSR
jgi:C-methyltransferase